MTLKRREGRERKRERVGRLFHLLIKMNCFLVGGDVSVDNEAYVVISSISRFNSPAEPFKDDYRNMVYVY
jgi:hypothetical protein